MSAFAVPNRSAPDVEKYIKKLYLIYVCLRVLMWMWMYTYLIFLKLKPCVRSLDWSIAPGNYSAAFRAVCDPGPWSPTSGALAFPSPADSPSPSSSRLKA